MQTILLGTNVKLRNPLGKVSKADNTWNVGAVFLKGEDLYLVVVNDASGEGIEVRLKEVLFTS